MPRKREIAPEFEKLGVFYLGRPYELEKRKPAPGWVLYDSKDLVTHAACVGMTGSGKTGLCLGLLEEAALDGIPALAIDPKGDLGNLLLTFPQLRPEDFRPWINEDEARREGASPEQYAAELAARWKKGLADWGQDGERIARMQAAAETVIFTPGSSAGLPLSILKSFAAPPEALRQDDELLHQYIGTAVASLLGLAGVDADPLQSREHILLATILERAWREGRDLGLPAIIEQVQRPPVTRIGVVELESFYPSKERFGFAMRLNHLLAAPGFELWLRGMPPDIGELLYTPEGKPRLAIVSIAHLADAERMFVVSLLLNQVVGWMRRQAGTSSLRAIVYMDEIAGYFPPVANPPSKAPLLTLLKQARAFGVGVVLATQNPVDLDYKGLANIGTWFLGRLQTERDKARVLEGLEGGSTAAGGWDRRRLDQLLSGLRSRLFLMHNVHEPTPVLFESRWTLSYLRGPLTRDQIARLMQRWKARETRDVGEKANDRLTLSGQARGEATVLTTRPLLSPEVPQWFVPIQSPHPSGAALLYEPRLLALGEVRFREERSGDEHIQQAARVHPLGQEVDAVEWDHAEAFDRPIGDLEKAPAGQAGYRGLSPLVGRRAVVQTWTQEFANWLYRSQRLELWRSPSLGETSRPGETEREFRIRLQQVSHEHRDVVTARLRRKYASKVAAVQERIRRAEQAKEREAEQATQHYVQTAISLGATLLGALLGRKALSHSTLGRAATAARGASRVIKERQDVTRAHETVEALRRQLAELEAQFEHEAAEIETLDPVGEQLERRTVRPSKADITVQSVGVVWVPYWRLASGETIPAC